MWAKSVFLSTKLTTLVSSKLRESALSVLGRGDLLTVLQQLDEEEDINKVLKYFSYEHFYVIYCKVTR